MCERITHLVSVGLAHYHSMYLTLVKVAIGGEKRKKNCTEMADKMVTRLTRSLQWFSWTVDWWHGCLEGLVV